MRTELLRFNGAVVGDPAIDAWIKQHVGGLGTIARRWFEVMRKCGDEVREILHDRCAVACLGDAPFGYVNVLTTHVSVGSFSNTTQATQGSRREEESGEPQSAIGRANRRFMMAFFQSATLVSNHLKLR